MMTGQPEGQEKRNQKMGENPQGFRTDIKDRSVSRAILNVRKAIHLVEVTPEGQKSLLAEGLVRFGQHHNLMSTTLLMWESTTTVGIQMGTLKESGVTPLIQIRNGSTALSRYVNQKFSSARKLALHPAKSFLEGQMSRKVEGLVKTGQRQNLTCPNGLT